MMCETLKQKCRQGLKIGKFTTPNRSARFFSVSLLGHMYKFLTVHVVIYMLVNFYSCTFLSRQHHNIDDTLLKKVFSLILILV